MADAYALDNDDYSEELEEVHGDIQDTLEADNYEDQLPQPEVSQTLFIPLNWPFDLFSCDHTGRRIDNQFELFKTKLHRLLWYRQTGSTYIRDLCLPIARTTRIKWTSFH